ncbi:hypothetical protein PMAC_002011 [Pneumocystis sp. 'macacae']|nr:hypothetical protein PMAC_002011 [Pneumocystis sp. 'macacae']
MLRTPAALTVPLRIPAARCTRLRRVSGSLVDALTATVKWAQRSSATEAAKNVLYLTVVAPNTVDPKVDVTATALSFHATTRTGIDYAVSLDLYADVDPESLVVNRTDRGVFVTLNKKELSDKYWPQLVKGGKCGFIRTDFDKWVDEDEQNGRADDLSQFGGMGDFDFNGFGGSGGDMPKLDETDEMDDDSESGSDMDGCGGEGLEGGDVDGVDGAEGADGVEGEGDA